MNVIVAVAAAFIGSAVAAGVNEERRGLLLRRESNEKAEPSIPCGDGTGASPDWANPGLPCNYGKSLSKYGGRLPYPEPLVESDVKVVLNHSRADELGYGDLYTTTTGPSTSGFARAMKPLIPGQEPAKTTTAQPVPDGLKEVFEWKKAMRSVDTPELKFPKVPEQIEENATDPTPAPTVLEGGKYYRPHFAGDQPYYLDEDEKMKKRPQYQNLKDSVRLFNRTTGKMSSKNDMPMANPNATQTRNPKKQRYVAVLESDEVKDIKKKADKKNSLYNLKASLHTEHNEGMGGIPAENYY
jgi:hypothetical protein